MELCKHIVAAAIMAFGTVQASAEPVLSIDAPHTVHAGQPFEVTLEVTWDGPAEAYAVFPAVWVETEGFQIVPVRMESRLVDGRPVIRQVMSFVIEEAGKVDLPAVTVSFATTQEGTQSPQDTSSTHPKTPQPSPLTVPPFPVEARPYRPLAWFYGALATVVLLCSGLGWWLASPQRSHQAQSPFFSPDANAAHQALEAAQRARIEGDLYAFYRELATALVAAPTNDPTLNERIKQRTADVGYRGARPNNDLLDGDYRDVARAVGHPKEDAAA